MRSRGAASGMTILSIILLGAIFPRVASVSSAGEADAPYFILGEDERTWEFITETGEIDFSDEKDRKWLLKGWGETEKGHTWAVGRSARFMFYLFNADVDKRALFHCKTNPLIANQTIDISLNGNAITTVRLATDKNAYEVVFPKPV